MAANLKDKAAWKIKVKEMKPSLGPGAIGRDQKELAKEAKISAFKLRTQLLEDGRYDTCLAATPDGLTCRIKVYANGGENELHEHRHEEHVFIILQGKAMFYGPDEEAVEIGVNEGIMLPKGMLYRFHSAGEENLVLLRIGHQSPEQKGSGRYLGDGSPITDSLQEELQGPTVFKADSYFG